MLGIDIGTTGCKAGIYDRNGRMLGSGYQTYKVDVTAEGAAEIDADLWVSAAVSVTRQAVAQSGVDPEAIAGIAVSGTNVLVRQDCAALRPIR